MRLDILYLAWNRLEFTMHTWAWLIAHTNWDRVNQLVVYDDGSEDGTLEFLRESVTDTPVRAELRSSDLRSPPAVMNHYAATSEADWFAKIDNDIALPGGWLDALCVTVQANPDLELLGMEAGRTRTPGRDGAPGDNGPFHVEPATHIGGVGLIRVDALRSRPRIPERGRFGWTEWQQRYEPSRGWIDPDLFCPQLDRVPVEPFVGLAERYAAEGWQRSWEKYDPIMYAYWQWFAGDRYQDRALGLAAS
jgi:glycosyltransferase involved in cell wall biosynthesis